MISKFLLVSIYCQIFDQQIFERNFTEYSGRNWAANFEHISNATEQFIPVATE